MVPKPAGNFTITLRPFISRVVLLLRVLPEQSLELAGALVVGELVVGASVVGASVVGAFCCGTSATGAFCCG